MTKYEKNQNNENWCRYWCKFWCVRKYDNAYWCELYHKYENWHERKHDNKESYEKKQDSEYWCEYWSKYWCIKKRADKGLTKEGQAHSNKFSGLFNLLEDNNL